VPPSHYGDTSLNWLRVNHGQVVDGSGRKVLLRGFNVDALVSYPKSPPAPLDEMDASLMQRAGFDVVRLGIDWAQLEPVRGRFDQAYLDRVGGAVAMLNRHGLYVVLDMHFRLGWSSDSATPARPGGPPSTRRTGIRCRSTPGVRPHTAAIASDLYFWLFSDWKADFYRAWQAVATRFKDNAGVAGYDIFNEAHPLPIPPRIFEKSYLWPMFKDAIEAIGAVDRTTCHCRRHPVAHHRTVVAPLKAPNVVYGAHLYEGSLIPPFFTGDPTFLRSRFRSASRKRRRCRRRSGSASSVTT